VNIKQGPAWYIGQQVFPTIQEAQKEELKVLLSDGGAHTEVAKAVIDSIINHMDEVIAILTCTPKSKGPRKPRSDIGKKRTKKDATPAII
jgi:hypothetical protein